MIINYQSQNLVQNLRALHVRHVVDAEAINTRRKETFPARERMRPYNWVVRLKIQTYVVSSAPGPAVHSARVVTGGLGEGGRFMRSG